MIGSSLPARYACVRCGLCPTLPFCPPCTWIFLSWFPFSISSVVLNFPVTYEARGLLIHPTTETFLHWDRRIH